jgi:hypothetical protein
MERRNLWCAAGCWFTGVESLTGKYPGGQRESELGLLVKESMKTSL